MVIIAHNYHVNLALAHIVSPLCQHVTFARQFRIASTADRDDLCGGAAHAMHCQQSLTSLVGYTSPSPNCTPQQPKVSFYRVNGWLRPCEAPICSVPTHIQTSPSPSWRAVSGSTPLPVSWRAVTMHDQRKTYAVPWHHVDGFFDPHPTFN
jgi:hypothetical protein